MVMLQAIAVGALFSVASQPILQWVIAIMMVSCISVITMLVIWLVVFFARGDRPGLLFDPRAIEASVHKTLYGSNESPGQDALLQDATFVVIPTESN